VAVHYPDLEAMVDAAIMVEDKKKAAHESRKRRMMNCNNSEIVIHFLINKVPNFGPK
jgi:hypothetical protein